MIAAQEWKESTYGHLLETDIYSEQFNKDSKLYILCREHAYVCITMYKYIHIIPQITPMISIVKYINKNNIIAIKRVNIHGLSTV